MVKELDSCEGMLAVEFELSKLELKAMLVFRFSEEEKLL